MLRCCRKPVQTYVDPPATEHPAVPETEFAAGDRVLLHSLAMTDYNGRNGTLCYFDEARGKWAVLLDGATTIMSLVFAKLTLLGEDDRDEKTLQEAQTLVGLGQECEPADTTAAQNGGRFFVVGGPFPQVIPPSLGDTVVIYRACDAVSTEHLGCTGTVVFVEYDAGCVEVLITGSDMPRAINARVKWTALQPVRLVQDQKLTGVDYPNPLFDAVHDGDVLLLSGRWLMQRAGYDEVVEEIPVRDRNTPDRIYNGEQEYWDIVHTKRTWVARCVADAQHALPPAVLTMVTRVIFCLCTCVYA